MITRGLWLPRIEEVSSIRFESRVFYAFYSEKKELLRSTPAVWFSKCILKEVNKIDFFECVAARPLRSRER